MATGSRIRDATFSVGSADGGSIAEGGRPAEEINPCFEKRRSPLLSQQRSLRQLSRRLSRRRAVVTAADTAGDTPAGPAAGPAGGTPSTTAAPQAGPPPPGFPPPPLRCIAPLPPSSPC